MSTTIQISQDLKEKIRNLGKAGESYETVIQRMYKVTSRHLLLAYLYDESDSVSIDEARRMIKNG